MFWGEVCIFCPLRVGEKLDTTQGDTTTQGTTGTHRHSRARPLYRHTWKHTSGEHATLASVRVRVMNARFFYTPDDGLTWGTWDDRGICRRAGGTMNTPDAVVIRVGVRGGGATHTQTHTRQHTTHRHLSGCDRRRCWCAEEPEVVCEGARTPNTTPL